MADKWYKDSASVVGGIGLYYGLKWVFTFFPAFILGLFICQQTDPELIDPHITGLIFMVVGYAVIQALIACEKYVVVIILYLITLWPFVHQVIMYFYHLDSGPGGTDQCFPVGSQSSSDYNNIKIQELTNDISYAFQSIS